MQFTTKLFETEMTKIFDVSRVSDMSMLKLFKACCYLSPFILAEGLYLFKTFGVF
jgi:hypothetical protein